MPNVYDFAERFRAALLQRDTRTARQLIQAYGLAFTRLNSQLTKLTTKIEDARARNEAITPAWLQREERFKALMRQVGAELNQLATVSDDLITRAQQAEVERALRDSGTVLSAAATDAGITATFNQVNTGAVVNLVGVLGDGSPLNKLLRQLPDDGRRQIEQALIEGVTLGENPRQVATRMREALGGNLTRALRIARTESLRAYRLASEANWKSSGLVESKQRICAKSLRTCAACLALDGAIYPIDAELDNHVNCRCVWIPIIDGQSVTSGRETGAEWFAKQTPENQARILGEAGAQAYREGMPLDAWVGVSHSAQWGMSRHQLPLKEVLARSRRT